jgi:23S rRNA (adenine-N6)-dimethyltransferase
VAVRARRARPVARPRSRHFLRSPRIAAQLVRAAGVSGDDLVLEIGAGDGRLTAELARTAGRVVAIELDARLAAGLRNRFAGTNVEVVAGDALAEPLPRAPFRVVANLPFHVTAALLRRLLDDPHSPLTGADVIVEWGAARKRATVWPSTQLGATWGAWYAFAVERRLPASCFAPPPSVDAGLLSVRRREPPLVPLDRAEQYRSFVRAGFSARTVREGLGGRTSPRALNRAADLYGFRRAAAARELDVHQWAGLFALAAGRGERATPISVPRPRRGQ